MAKKTRYAQFRDDAVKNQKKKKKAGDDESGVSYLKANWHWLKFFILPPVVLLAGVVAILAYHSFDEVDWISDVMDNLFLASDSGPKDYDPAHVKECLNMERRYAGARLTRESGPLGPLLGLSEDASRKEARKRCVTFARIVAVMQNVSRHRHHSFLCQGAKFDIGDKYSFLPDPDAKGVNLIGYDKVKTGIDRTDVKRFAIPHNRMQVVREWQFYNVGDGCLVVGHSGPYGNGFKLDR